MAFVFVNNVNTTLADPITTSTQTTITLTSSAGLPTLSAGQILALTLNDAATQSQYEIVYVTAISGATLTVERGQEGTTATTWLAGDFAFCAVTAGELSDFATSGGIESITAGAGIEVTSGENPTISNTGILAISVGAGLSDSGGQSPTLQNTGVLSVTAGAGLSSSGGAQTPTLSVAGGTAGQPGSFAFNAGIVPMTLRYNYTSVITTCLTAGDGNPFHRAVYHPRGFVPARFRRRLYHGIRYDEPGRYQRGSDPGRRRSNVERRLLHRRDDARLP